LDRRKNQKTTRLTLGGKRIPAAEVAKGTWHTGGGRRSEEKKNLP